MADEEDEVLVKSDLWPRLDGRVDWTLRVPSWGQVATGTADDPPDAYRQIREQVEVWAGARGSLVAHETKIIRLVVDPSEQREGLAKDS